MFEPAVIGLYPVIGIPFHVVPRRRDQLVEHPRIDGAASVTTSDGVTFSVVNAQRKNRRAASPSRRFDTSTSMICPCWSTAR